MFFITKFGKRGASALAAVLLVLSIALGSLFVVSGSATATTVITSINEPLKEAGCGIMHLVGLDTKYALPGAGPIIDPITQDFVQVILVRNYKADGSLDNTFHARALRYSVDCQRLIYSADVQTPLGIAGSNISIYYAGQTDLLTKVYRGLVDPATVSGPEYVFFGTATRLPDGVPGGGNFQDGVLTVYVGDMSQR